MLASAKPGDNLRKIFNPKVFFGSALLEHSFLQVGFSENYKIDDLNIVDIDRVEQALHLAEEVMNSIDKNVKGYIIQKEEQRHSSNLSSQSSVTSYIEFHPLLFNQHKLSSKTTYIEFESFNKAVDVFFSSIEGQKLDQKALQQEKDALKKLDNVRKDHEKRLQELNRLQEEDNKKASLIEMNSELIEKALLIMRSAIANQFSWTDIEELIKEAQARYDPVACAIKKLDLNKNQITMLLSDPFDENEKKTEEQVVIDLDLSAYRNARRYYDMKRYAAQKEQKTRESSGKALKSAEWKTQQALKDVAIKTLITKARKILWFEKFFWFISSENYLVIAGRDAQQNELIVKRYLKPGDIYVHADLHGASSVVIKNHKIDEEIPPKTLEEAGTMAVCYSSAWESKISSRSWWVYHHQVSKTAPSGEYLTVGAFIIRGKKNYLPMHQLIIGFGFLFRLDEESIIRHKDERKAKVMAESEKSVIVNDVEIEVNESDNDDDDDDDDDEDNDNNDGGNEIGSSFPDTQIKSLILKDKHNDDNFEIAGSQQPRIKMKQFKLKKSASSSKGNTKLDKNQEINIKGQQHLKRGQKSKLKKIKEKYKDQDEEERKLKMAILGFMPLKSEQNKVNQVYEESNEECNEECNEEESKGNKLAQSLEKTQLKKEESEPLTKVQEGDIRDEDEDEDEEEKGKEESQLNNKDDQIKLLESLTGQPLPEDNLLYTIPIVGPYSCLSNYKYKVKVLPGQNKRGKAAKTVLQFFLNNKSCTQLEKNLLKNAKDQDIGRNLPNNIKISAINLNSVKKKAR